MKIQYTEEEEATGDDAGHLLYSSHDTDDALDEVEDAFLTDSLAVAGDLVVVDERLEVISGGTMSHESAHMAFAGGAKGTSAPSAELPAASSPAVAATQTAPSTSPSQEYMPAYRLKSKVGPSGVIEPRDESTYLAVVPDLMLPGASPAASFSPKLSITDVSSWRTTPGIVSTAECVYDPSITPNGGADVDGFLRRAVQRLVSQRAEAPAVPAVDLAALLLEGEGGSLSASEDEGSDGDSKQPSGSAVSRTQRSAEASGVSSSPAGGIPKNSIVSRLGGVVEVADGGPGRKRTRSSSSSSVLDIPPKLSPRSLRRRTADRVAEIARRTTASASSSSNESRTAPLASRRVMFVDGALVLLHPSIIDILLTELKKKNFDEEGALEAACRLSGSLFSIWSVREQHAFLSAYIRFGDNIERVYREILVALRSKTVRDVVDYYYRCVCPAAKLEEDYAGLRKETDSRSTGRGSSLYRPYITHSAEPSSKAGGDHIGASSSSGIGMRTRGRTIAVPGDHTPQQMDGDFSLTAAARFIRHARSSLDTLSFSQTMNSILLSNKGIISPAELIVRIRRIFCQAVFQPQASVGPGEMLREFLALLPEPARRALLSSGLVAAVESLSRHASPHQQSMPRPTERPLRVPATASSMEVMLPKQGVVKTATYRAKTTEEVFI